MKSRIASLLVAAAIGLTGVVAVPATPAFAVSCSGTGCNGKDPGSTGCNNDAITVATANVKGSDGTKYGEVKLRWSPTCQTNWGRWDKTNGTGSASMDVSVRRQDNAWKTNSWGNAPETANSPMVYAPGVCADAKVELQYLGANPWAASGKTDKVCG